MYEVVSDNTATPISEGVLGSVVLGAAPCEACLVFADSGARRSSLVSFCPDL